MVVSRRATPWREVSHMSPTLGTFYVKRRRKVVSCLYDVLVGSLSLCVVLQLHSGRIKQARDRRERYGRETCLASNITDIKWFLIVWFLWLYVDIHDLLLFQHDQMVIIYCHVGCSHKALHHYSVRTTPDPLFVNGVWYSKILQHYRYMTSFWNIVCTAPRRRQDNKRLRTGCEV